MFELSVAFKYLIPRWRQLSVSIISLISTLVIALVVWLIVVFFSVKDGLENSWIDKIVAVTAPVRITPTESYYQSYYYLIDSISANSDYTLKSISEKLGSSYVDPYDPESDEEIPVSWPKADLNEKGELKDLVKLATERTANLKGFEGLKISDYETTLSNLRIRLVRYEGKRPTQSFLEHAAFLSSFDADTPSMVKAILPLTNDDINNLLRIQSISMDNIQEENSVAIKNPTLEELQLRLQNFFNNFTVESLLVPEQGWRIPKHLLPTSADKQTIPLVLPPGHELKSTLDEQSLASIKEVSEIRFFINTSIQGFEVSGNVRLGSLKIGKAKLKDKPLEAEIAYVNSERGGVVIPQKRAFGEPLLLPRSFKEGKALIGDLGFLSYFSLAPSAMQEQRIPVYIAGFYDPGIIPFAGKLILANKALVSQIQNSSNQQSDPHLGSGINIRFDRIADAGKVKAALQSEFKETGIAPYWKIATYQEYEFTKDIIEQLQSEKNLFSLISLVIIIVACSNIISMLIILVNDKKLEIGILRSMGASSTSIAAIFGICGIVMGALGSVIGVLAALLTLRYVNELVGFISKIQGHDLFNPVFYGSTLPTDLSMEAISFVMITTALISLLAGIVPAVKACLMKPSTILRSE